MSSGRYSHFIITGGTGYLGEAVTGLALAAGLRVSLLSPHAKSRIGVRHIAWRLGEALPEEALDPEVPPAQQVLIHLAYDWRDTDCEAGINLAGAYLLRDSARDMQIGRCIFISSQSARPDALNAYGRLKSHIEQLFDAPNEISLRVGLVYGGPWKGQYGLLCRLAMATSLIPMVLPHQLVQPIHRNEVAKGIMLAAESSIAGTLGLASAQPIPFSQFLDGLAWRLRGGRLRLIPIPLSLALRLCILVNKLPFLPRIDRERILGLAGTCVISTKDDLDRLGLRIHPFTEGMLGEPAARRALLQEGRSFFRYVLGQVPDQSLLCHYCRAIIINEADGAMRLPRILHFAPWLLRVVEPLGASGVLARRLKLATALAAAHPQTAQVLDHGGRAGRLARLGSALWLEMIALPIRLLATKMRQ